MTTVIIVGAGVAGPVTAMALQKAGFEAVLYEARQPEASRAGVFLTLATNGIEALRVLGSEGVIEAGFETAWITLRNSAGKRLGRTPVGLTPPDGPTSKTIRRADLYHALLDEALQRGIEVRFGHRLADAVTSSDRVTATFADGSSAEADLLVGADGVHSTVRRLIDPGAVAPAYGGLLSTGGYVPGATVDVEPGSYEMVFGKRAFFGYVAAPDDSVWWFANLPEPREPRQDAIGTAEALRARLLDAFDADAGPASRLIASTGHLAPATPIHTVEGLRHWHGRRMVLVGDAAHAASPTSGQGASLAIEDAVVLAKALRDRPDPAQACASYVAARLARVESIVRAAKRINRNKAAGPVAAAVRDRVIPHVLRLVARSGAMTRQFHYRIDWDAPVQDEGR